MKKVVSIGFTLVLGITASGAQGHESDGKGYLGVSHSFLTYEDDAFSEDIDLGVVVGQAGTLISPYFAMEVRAGTGTYDSRRSANDVSASIEVDYLIGGYGLFGIPTEPIYPYVIVGMTRGKLSFSAQSSRESVSVSETESDFSYGVGAKISLGESLNVTWEYLRYFDENDYEISGITIGGQYLF